MDATDDGDVIATRGDVVAVGVAGGEGIRGALVFLDEAAAEAGAPLVDEAERDRLERVAAGRGRPEPGWRPVLARRAGVVVGYAGVVLPATAGAEPAAGDVAVHRGRVPSEPVLATLLTAASRLADQHRAGRLTVWLRHATADELACASAEGFEVERRLGVLGRAVDVPGAVAPPPGIGIRAFRPGVDDDAVVAVLGAAYAGTPDGGWTRERFAAKRALPWFRPDDLLVADAGDGVLRGVHWLKRRGGDVGEVYNLAVAPEAQGSGLGRALLAAGLAHLAAVGVRDVVLWVDLANEAAVRLYTAHGFRTRWEDVALRRELSDERAAP